MNSKKTSKRNHYKIIFACSHLCQWNKYVKIILERMSWNEKIFKNESKNVHKRDFLLFEHLFFFAVWNQKSAHLSIFSHRHLLFVFSGTLLLPAEGLELISGSRDDLPPPPAFSTWPQECPPAFCSLCPPERLALSHLQMVYFLFCLKRL